MEQQDQLLTKKERKELKREERSEGHARERKMRKTKKLAVWAILLGVVAVAGWFGIQAITPEPLSTDYSKAMPYEKPSHIVEGTKVSYGSNHPTSGNHWPDPLRDGVYDTEKPDEALVHSLEHGRVWVSYKPEIGTKALQALKDTLKGRFGVILTPRSANERDIALAAWTRLDSFNLLNDGTFDKNRILDFISRYLNKGPEYVPQMTGKTYE